MDEAGAGGAVDNDVDRLCVVLNSLQIDKDDFYADEQQIHETHGEADVCLPHPIEAVEAATNVALGGDDAEECTLPGPTAKDIGFVVGGDDSGGEDDNSSGREVRKRLQLGGDQDTTAQAEPAISAVASSQLPSTPCSAGTLCQAKDSPSGHKLMCTFNGCSNWIHSQCARVALVQSALVDREYIVESDTFVCSAHSKVYK